MIAFENVSKSFWTGKTRKVILDRASFKVEVGNSLGILAPNGAGKTTIINMMAGLEKPDEGEIIRTSHLAHLVSVGVHGRGDEQTFWHRKLPLYCAAVRAGP
jgi:ABC-type polysaccharide/polyol phosphate transport system ATPase subunit